MATDVMEPETAAAPPSSAAANEAPLVKYSPSDAQIATWKEQFANLPALVGSPEGYEQARLARATTRKARVAIEAKRKELKADSLAWGRKVDAEAGRLTAELFAIEEPIAAAMKAVDDEKERVKREAEEKEAKRIEDERLAKLAAEEAEHKRLRDLEEARLHAERERLAAERRKLEEEQAAEHARVKAEQDRVAAEQKAERDRLAEERRVIEQAQQRERDRLEALRREDEEKRLAERRRLDAEAEAVRQAQRKEQAKIDEDRRKVQAEKDKLAAEKAAKIAADKAIAEAHEKLKREQQEEAARREEEAKASAAEAARIEAMRPDVERVHRFAATLRAIHAPEVQSAEARSALALATERLALAAEGLEGFSVTTGVV